MDALREIVEDAPERLTLDLPPHLRHRRLEVIILPLEEPEAERHNHGIPPYRTFPTDQVVILTREELHER